MFKRFRLALSKPKLVPQFIKDSWGRIVFYLLLIPILLLIPVIVEMITKPGLSNDQYVMIRKDVLTKLTLDATLDNNILTLNSGEGSYFTEGDFTFGFRSEVNTQTNYNLIFSESRVNLYFMSIKVYEISYEKLDLGFIDFNSLDLKTARKITVAINEVMSTSAFLNTYSVLYEYFLSVISFVFMVLLMSLLFSFGNRVPFKLRFKLSTYLSTIYIIIILTGSLFGLPSVIFDVIGTIVVIVYHVIAYRSFRIIPISKGGIGGPNE